MVFGNVRVLDEEGVVHITRRLKINVVHIMADAGIRPYLLSVVGDQREIELRPFDIGALVAGVLEIADNGRFARIVQVNVFDGELDDGPCQRRRRENCRAEQRESEKRENFGCD